MNTNRMTLELVMPRGDGRHVAPDRTDRLGVRDETHEKVNDLGYRSSSRMDVPTTAAAVEGGPV